jgi:chromosome segregation ATPase
MKTETKELINELRKLPDALMLSKYGWGTSMILEAADRLEELNRYEHGLTDDLDAAHHTIRGLEKELEKADEEKTHLVNQVGRVTNELEELMAKRENEMSDKSDTKSTERPINKTGLRVAMYAAKLNESVEELEKENAALRQALDHLRAEVANAVKQDCRKLHRFEEICATWDAVSKDSV